MTAECAALKRLWMQAFSDPEEVPEAFFSTAFSPARYNTVRINGVPVSALYWLDCSLQDSRFAYIYAVATDCAFRGKGYAGRLMEDTHRLLKQAGYAGAILVPGEPWLFEFYQKFGYRVFSTVQEFTCSQGEQSAELESLDYVRYATVRRKYLPAGGLLQEGETLAFLQTYANFYSGKDFVMAASQQNNTLIAHELLGNFHAAKDILRTLDMPQGHFRAPGPGNHFAMFCPLQENCPTPAYFGLALD